ncbi:hypothetical protein WA158_005358 [Blastocystis sp. Blastoise]
MLSNYNLYGNAEDSASWSSYGSVLSQHSLELFPETASSIPFGTPKVHSGMTIEELKDITSQRLNNQKIYYEIPAPVLDVYGRNIVYLNPESAYKINYFSCYFNENFDETSTGRRRWSSYDSDTMYGYSDNLYSDDSFELENSPSSSSSLSDRISEDYPLSGSSLFSGTNDSLLLDDSDIRFNDEMVNEIHPSNPVSKEVDIDHFFDFSTPCYFDISSLQSMSAAGLVSA